MLDRVPMTCQEFLARHSEYVDGVLGPREVARWEAHASSCASCARYDRVVRGGRRLVSTLPEVEPSSDFFPRLQHRIYNLEEALRAGARAPGVGAMLSLAVAGTLAVLAWSPLLRLGLGADDPAASARAVAEGGAGDAAPGRRPAEPARRTGDRGGTVQLAAEAKELPHIEPVPGSWGGGPAPAAGIAESWWWAAGTGQARAAASLRAMRTVDFRIPGPYSPLVVEAPAFRRPSILTRTEGGRLGRD